jgi:hypothetical protein
MMNVKIEKELVDNAIANLHAPHYPVSVNGQGFADDMAHALSVINTLLIEVDRLSKVIELSLNKEVEE